MLKAAILLDTLKLAGVCLKGNNFLPGRFVKRDRKRALVAPGTLLADGAVAAIGGMSAIGMDASFIPGRSMPQCFSLWTDEDVARRIVGECYAF